MKSFSSIEIYIILNIPYQVTITELTPMGTKIEKKKKNTCREVFPVSALTYLRLETQIRQFSETTNQFTQSILYPKYAPISTFKLELKLIYTHAHHLPKPTKQSN